MAKSAWGAIGKALGTGIKNTIAANTKKNNTSSSSSSSSNRGSSSSSGGYTASGSGGSYNISSDKGKNFVSGAAAGSTMTGGDGSVWKKNNDGTTTITKGGQTWTYGSSGGGSSYGGSSGGSSYGNSSGGSSNDWLKQAQANSNAWHTADAATRKRLQEENQRLYTAHGYTYNGKTGTWSAPLSAEQQQRKNSLNNTDWSTVIGGQIASGGRWQDVEDSLNNRNEKILLNGGKLDQYSNDATAQNAKNYINQMKQVEEQYQAELDRQEQIKQQQQAYYDRMADQINQQYSAMLPGLNQSYDEAARQA